MFKNNQDEVVTMALSDIGGGGVGMSDPNSPSGTGEVFNSYLGSEAPNSALGEYSHAEGFDTRAIGYYGHAEGLITMASGEASHAEGFDTRAIGDYGHAEGYSTNAIGLYSHAQGLYTSANGFCSHAEGERTIANGSVSHAEGYKTIANGNYSHAEGRSTSAYGIDSHAEGSTTIASGLSSHAEGNHTIAKGEASHAEGYYTSAIALYSHAEGYRTITSGISSHAGGQNSLAEGMYSFAHGEVSALSMNSVAFGQFNYPVSGISEPRIGESKGSAATFFSLGAGIPLEKANALEIKNNGDMYIYGVGGYTGRNSPGMPTTGAQPIQEVLGKYTLILSATNYNLRNWAFVDGEGTVLEGQNNDGGFGLNNYLAKYSGVTAGIPDMTILMVQTSNLRKFNKFRVSSFFPPMLSTEFMYDIYFIDNTGTNRYVRYYCDDKTLELHT